MDEKFQEQEMEELKEEQEKLRYVKRPEDFKDLEIPVSLSKERQETVKENVEKKIEEFRKEHNTKIFSFSVKPEEPIRKAGDRWVDNDGYEWLQLSANTRMRLPKIELSDYRMPYTCPRCKNEMKKRLDKKFWYLRKMCFDCVTEVETQMRIDGTYEEYERGIMKNNMKSFIKDAENGLTDYIESLKSNSYVSEFGDVEKWDSIDVEFVQQMVLKDIQKLKELYEEQFSEKYDGSD